MAKRNPSASSRTEGAPGDPSGRRPSCAVISAWVASGSASMRPIESRVRGSSKKSTHSFAARPGDRTEGLARRGRSAVTVLPNRVGSRRFLGWLIACAVALGYATAPLCAASPANESGREFPASISIDDHLASAPPASNEPRLGRQREGRASTPHLPEVPWAVSFASVTFAFHASRHAGGIAPERLHPRRATSSDRTSRGPPRLSLLRLS